MIVTIIYKSGKIEVRSYDYMQMKSEWYEFVHIHPSIRKSIVYKSKIISMVITG